jgi:hypothetical protein
MQLIFSVLITLPLVITHITDKASANRGKCASYPERVPCREYSKMYEKAYLYTKVHLLVYIPVARIRVNTNHKYKYRFLTGTFSIML